MELPIRRYTFLNHAHNSVKNKINKTTNKKINFATRPARTDPAAREHALARPKMRISPSWLPPEPQRLARGTHVIERQAGEEKDTAVKLIASDSSSEVSGATAVNSLVRIYWCPQLKLLAWLPGLATSTAAHGRDMAGFGEMTALLLECETL